MKGARLSTEKGGHDPSRNLGDMHIGVVGRRTQRLERGQKSDLIGSLEVSDKERLCRVRCGMMGGSEVTNEVVLALNIQPSVWSQRLQTLPNRRLCSSMPIVHPYNPTATYSYYIHTKPVADRVRSCYPYYRQKTPSSTSRRIPLHSGFGAASCGNPAGRMYVLAFGNAAGL